MSSSSEPRRDAESASRPGSDGISAANTPGIAEASEYGPAGGFTEEQRFDTPPESPQKTLLTHTKDPRALLSHPRSDSDEGILEVPSASGDDPEVGRTESRSDGDRTNGDRNGEARPFVGSSENSEVLLPLNEGSRSVSNGAPSVSKGAPSMVVNRQSTRGVGGGASEPRSGYDAGGMLRFAQGLLPRSAQVLLAPIKEHFWTITALAAAVSGAAILVAVTLSFLLVPAAVPSSKSQAAMPLQEIGVPFNLTWQGYSTYLQQLEPLQQHVGLPSIPFHPLPRGPHGFIQFSAYRLASRTFAAVGFGAHFLKDHLGTVECLWQGGQVLELKGRSTIIYTNLRQESDYDAIVIKCEFEESTGDAGGDLFLTISQEPFLTLRESTALDHSIVPPDFDQLPHLLTICAVRMGREVEARTVHEWVSYHWHLGATQFRLYDAGSMDQSLATVLDAFLRNDSIQVIPTGHLSFYNIEYNAHSLSALDCLYSTHFTSKWVTVLPPDSYLYIAPPHTLPSFLAHYASRPWLTYGAHEWSTEKCREGIAWENATTEEWMGKREVTPFVVEWLAYRRRENVCEGGGEDREKCIGEQGQRSHFTNPRKAGVLAYNEVRETDSSGEHVAYSEMHKNVYPKLHERSGFNQTCREVGAAEEWDGWVRDVTAADFAKLLRKSPPPTA